MTCIIQFFDNNENEIVNTLVLEEFYDKKMYEHINKLVREVKEENPDEWSVDDIMVKIGQHYKVLACTIWEVAI